MKDHIPCPYHPRLNFYCNHIREAWLTQIEVALRIFLPRTFNCRPRNIVAMIVKLRMIASQVPIQLTRSTTNFYKSMFPDVLLVFNEKTKFVTILINAPE
jgi:hypothetical protein